MYLFSVKQMFTSFNCKKKPQTNNMSPVLLTSLVPVLFYFVTTPEVVCTLAAWGLTLVWKRWLLRRQRRVLPLVCVQITPWFARSWSDTEPCWTCRSSPSLSWKDTCRTRPQVGQESPQQEARRTRRGSCLALMIMGLS